MRLSLSALIAAAGLSLGLPATALSAELIMVAQRACGYCANFDRELGSQYDSTVAGQIAPLRRVSPLKPWPVDLAAVTPVHMTPVFIVVDGGKEVGRFPGYDGEEGFWQRLNPILAKLPNGHVATK